jgi:xanthine dehydrogenase iron-sulfur cluster and FAD-binding subunit A
MEFLRPATWSESLEMKAAHPRAVAIQGGTDVMVEMNFDLRRPPALLDLNPVAELATWELDGDTLRVGAGVTYARLIRELGDRLPGLAQGRLAADPQPRHGRRQPRRRLACR